MRTVLIPHTNVQVSQMGFGLAGLPSWAPGPVTNEDVERVERLIRGAVEAGITLLDTASPYALGRSETVMGRAFARSPGLRDTCVIQTKCGQIMCDDEGAPVAPRIDLSKREIVTSAERSLRRLRTETLDILLLHQPTPLMEPEEIAAALDQLHQSGKVRAFGLSNFTPGQSRLLQQVSPHRFVVNQLRISIYHPHHILEGMAATLGVLEHLEGFHARVTGASPPQRPRSWSPASDSALDYARAQDIQVQAWSPLRHRSPGQFQPATDFAALEQCLDAMARAHGVTPQALALAWLMRHPAGIVPIMSTTNAEHLAQNARAADLRLTDSDWYALFSESIRSIGV